MQRTLKKLFQYKRSKSSLNPPMYDEHVRTTTPHLLQWKNNIGRSRALEMEILISFIKHAISEKTAEGHTRLRFTICDCERVKRWTTDSDGVPHCAIDGSIVNLPFIKWLYSDMAFILEDTLTERIVKPAKICLLRRCLDANKSKDNAKGIKFVLDLSDILK